MQVHTTVGDLAHPGAVSLASTSVILCRTSIDGRFGATDMERMKVLFGPELCLGKENAAWR